MEAIMMEPLISVILPVYNAELYLSEAVDSILNQTVNDFELILIDDGSTDGSLSIAQAYAKQDERVVLISQPNMGLVETLNKGISLAKGRYIARMDADDISLENRFEEQVKLLEKGYDLCGCHFHLVTESGKLHNSLVVSTDSEFQSVILTRAVPFAHGSVMIRKSFLLENDLEYCLGEYSSAEDYYLWINCFKHGAKIGNVDKYLFLYRDFELSLSKVNSKKNIKDAQSISRKFIKENYKKIEGDIKRRLSKKTNLNIFEQEQLAFFLFNTLFKRSLTETKVYFHFIKADIRIISFFRFVRFIFLYIFRL
ncbi:glycosyltransferase [Vibrio aestuarianus]|uniref:glycosyltransferase family 2 protein n=1 Tax=Vibrio aestuarianus TaxID=28171 RepID=UPI00237D2FEB|nr:glycosyltransferase family 2 protein [Vibrio aestuarianus]MDE1313008.1 glycosyltransferase [Vibrio aestuarianus]